MLKNILTSTLTAVVISLLTLSFIPAKNSVKNESVLGSQIQTILVWLGGGVKVGNLGNNITKIIASSCNLIMGKTAQAASTTIAYDCALNGIRTNDTIMAQLATSTVGSSILGWKVGSARASSTPNFVTVYVENNTGASAVPSATSVGTSTRIYVLDN